MSEQRQEISWTDNVVRVDRLTELVDMVLLDHASWLPEEVRDALVTDVQSRLLDYPPSEVLSIYWKSYYKQPIVDGKGE